MGSASSRRRVTPSRSTRALPETLRELKRWANARTYWASVLGQAHKALEGWPTRMQFQFPKNVHPLIFTADCVHAMTLLAPERGVDFKLEGRTHDPISPQD